MRAMCTDAVEYPPTTVGYPPTAVGYPPTAVGYPPTAVGYHPTAVGYPPTAVGYPPTAVGYPPTAVGYPPTAVGYPPTAIGYPPTTVGYPPDRRPFMQELHGTTSSLSAMVTVFFSGTETSAQSIAQRVCEGVPCGGARELPLTWEALQGAVEPDGGPLFALVLACDKDTSLPRAAAKLVRSLKQGAGAAPGPLRCAILLLSHAVCVNSARADEGALVANGRRLQKALEGCGVGVDWGGAAVTLCHVELEDLAVTVDPWIRALGRAAQAPAAAPALPPQTEGETVEGR